MNEKYIQAIILGSLIGGAILFDDYVKPEKERGMKKHMIIKKSDYKNGDISELEGIKDRKSTRLNSSHSQQSRMPSSA